MKDVIYIYERGRNKRICFNDFLIAKYLHTELGYTNVRIDGKRYWYDGRETRKVASPYNRLDMNSPNGPHEIWLAAKEYIKTIHVDGLAPSEIEQAFEHHKISYHVLAGVLEDMDRDNISVYLKEILP